MQTYTLQTMEFHLFNQFLKKPISLCISLNNETPLTANMFRYSLTEHLRLDATWDVHGFGNTCRVINTVIIQRLNTNNNFTYREAIGCGAILTCFITPGFIISGEMFF